MVPHFNHLTDFILQLLTGMRLFSLSGKAGGNKTFISGTGKDIHTGTVVPFLRVQPFYAVPACLNVALCNL